MSGVSTNDARTRASNGVNDVGAGFRTYLGGPSDAITFATVFRESPNLTAILAFGTPSADQGPVLHRDHTPIGEECSLFKRRYRPIFERRREATRQPIRSSAAGGIEATELPEWR